MYKTKTKLFVLLAAALLSAQSYDDIPFKQWRCNDSVLIRHLTGAGVYGQLDGPAEEAFCNVYALNSDTAGNIYFYNQKTCAISVIRKSDNRVYTLTGNKSITQGRSSPGFGLIGNNGPARRLRFVKSDGAVVISVVGDPLNGNGVIYLSDDNAIIRLYINHEQNDTWWFEHMAGPGTADPTTGISFSSVRIYGASYRYIPSKNEFMLKTLGQWDNQVYWVRDGKLYPVIPDSLLIGGAANQLDGADNFVFTQDTNVYLLNSNTWKFTDTLHMPYKPEFGFFVDPKRQQYFYRGMDDYRINRLRPGDVRSTLMADGSWQTVAKNDRNGIPWALPSMMDDGRLAGTDMSGNVPVFVVTFLDSIGLHVTAVEDAAPLQESVFNLGPNPFNPSLNIRVNGWLAGARLCVFDINGRMIADLTKNLNSRSGKIRTITWSASGHASGAYLVVLRNGGKVLKQKAVLVR